MIGWTVKAEQQVGRAREPDQVALGDDQRVGDEAPHAATSSALLGRPPRRRGR